MGKKKWSFYSFDLFTFGRANGEGWQIKILDLTFECVDDVRIFNLLSSYYGPSFDNDDAKQLLLVVLGIEFIFAL